MIPENVNNKIEQDQSMKTDHLLPSSHPNEAVENSDDGKKKKKKSALVAAANARSAVGHVDAHRITGLPSNFAHTGTNLSYEEP